MHILKTVQAYYPFQEKGGPVVKVRALSRSLSLRGHAVTVLSPDLGLSGRGHLKLEIERCRWGSRVKEAGVEAIYVPTLVRYRALTINPRVIDFCSSRSGHSTLFISMGFTIYLARSSVFIAANTVFRTSLNRWECAGPIDRSINIKKFWHRSIGRGFWRHADRIVATSELERQELFEDGVSSEKLVMRYNGVDPVPDEAKFSSGSFRRKLGIPREESLILFLSRLVPRKGADVLIRAFAKACPTSGRLVIAGPEAEAGYLPRLKKIAIELGVDDRVSFTGALFDDEKSKAFCDADIFVLPSKYENFANVAAEAIAFGVPVIISPFCGIRSLVTNRAGLVIPPDANSLADALRRVLDDKAYYELLREGCKEVASQLSWERLALQMEDYYRDVLVSQIARD